MLTIAIIAMNALVTGGSSIITKEEAEVPSFKTTSSMTFFVGMRREKNTNPPRPTFTKKQKHILCEVNFSFSRALPCERSAFYQAIQESLIRDVSGSAMTRFSSLHQVQTAIFLPQTRICSLPTPEKHKRVFYKKGVLPGSNARCFMNTLFPGKS